MSRKPRRKKNDPVPASPSAESPPAETPSEAPGSTDDSPETRGTDTEAAPEVTATASEATPPPTRTSKLPSFGFAADLLAARSTSEDTTDDTSSEEASTESSSADASHAAGASPLDSPDRPNPGDELAATSPNRPDEPAIAPDRIFHFADSLEREEEDEAVAQRLTTWITFSLEGETFALPVEPVREVLRLSHITRVPHAPRPIRGVTNLRGRVIPVIDLRVRIELPALSIDRSTRVIVVDSRGRLIGLLVDAVHQVAHIDLNRVQPPPDDVMTQQSDYLAGVYQQDERLILLLDVDRALIIRETDPVGLGQGAA